MFKILVTSAVVLTATAASAQNLRYFATTQECGEARAMVQANPIAYGETPLFSLETTTITAQGQPVQGASLFFVNQTSGTWTMLTMYRDGTACVSAAGIDFEPYVD